VKFISPLPGTRKKLYQFTAIDDCTRIRVLRIYDKLQEWEDFYNFHRPHGGLNGQTPYDRLRQKTMAQV